MFVKNVMWWVGEVEKCNTDLELLKVHQIHLVSSKKAVNDLSFEFHHKSNFYSPQNIQTL